ncbi:MAG: hypothetical protein KF830_18980 [Planctomycetes bacterium]|nr:hypothetical protein [Planctomycetota bacterium]
MHRITRWIRSLVAMLVLVGISVAQDVAGTATFPSDTYACTFEQAGDPFEASGAGTVQPDPEGDPPGTKLTIRWYKMIIGDQEWIMIERDEVLLGGVCPATGDAWLNNGGLGESGTFTSQ